MYIAKQIHQRRPRYTLRQTCSNPDGSLTFQDLADLGDTPSLFIEYPGGNAFYIAEALVDHLEQSGVDVDPDLLESLFWPFVAPRIRRTVETFHNRSRKTVKRSQEENESLQRSIASFDKRRLHYLRFGTMDQGPVEAMPTAIMKDLAGKCRDEIEQYFLRQEAQLEPTELKSYVFAAFDLHRFFMGILAKKMPQALDQERVDRYFLEEICRLNEKLFQDASPSIGAGLHPYLVRYLILFFDHDYLHTTLLDEFTKDFMDRHRFFKPPPPKPLFSLDKAAAVFGLNPDEVASMTRKSLTQRYRTLAHTHHPDKGGSPEQFVELNEAFQRLIRKLGKGD
ncbi:MAG: J domain-containing protein [Desulfobacterium sp.]|nr:J domain-containing protein [Desulfobacterium sp.]